MAPVLRPFEPADDEACKLLEVTASQFQELGGLIKAAITHHKTFDAKVRQFENSLLLVALEGSQLFGVIAVGFKRVWIHGATRLCGYVFDLRIAGSHQGRGLGKWLAAEAEARCAQLGAEILYLSVNRTNLVARKLYSSLGWSFASRRILFARPLLLPRSSPPGVAVRFMAMEDAVDLVTKYYAARPLGPPRAECLRLFTSPLYLGTLTCEDGLGSRASISLWHGSAFSGFKFLRVFLPVSAWRHLAPCLLVAMLYFMSTKILLVASTFISLPLWGRAMLLPPLLLSVSAVSYLIYWLRTRKEFRCRVFAPVVEGPAWQPLMLALYTKACNEGRNRGFALLFLNEDANSEVGECIAGKGSHSPTEFWQKVLAPHAFSGQVGPWPSDSFFDPRDF
mmetsp:Transcript_15270/g.32198  ORF Transcript_15270/g.32198 Transcript_15270/m.32198 type:complete len:394 (+) Transcript_15270:27-1208(+)